MSELPTTREALIWQIVTAIAGAEGKASGNMFNLAPNAREYIGTLVKEAKTIVDGEKVALKPRAQADTSPMPGGDGGWMAK